MEKATGETGRSRSRSRSRSGSHSGLRKASCEQSIRARVGPSAPVSTRSRPSPLPSSDRESPSRSRAGGLQVASKPASTTGDVEVLRRWTREGSGGAAAIRCFAIGRIGIAPETVATPEQSPAQELYSKRLLFWVTTSANRHRHSGRSLLWTRNPGDGSKLSDEIWPRLKPRPIIFIAPAPNCAALPERIMESEMFCYAGGVFE